jgi:hypothetical protein
MGEAKKTDRVNSQELGCPLAPPHHQRTKLSAAQEFRDVTLMWYGITPLQTLFHQAVMVVMSTSLCSMSLDARKVASLFSDKTKCKMS